MRILTNRLLQSMMVRIGFYRVFCTRETLTRKLCASKRRMKCHINKAETSLHARYQAILHEQRTRHASELERTKALVDAIVKRGSGIEFDECVERNQYMLSLMFSPSLVGAASCPQDELKILAERIGRRVEHEIATSKFIEMRSPRDWRVQHN